MLISRWIKCWRWQCLRNRSALLVGWILWNWAGDLTGLAQTPYDFCQPEVIHFTRQAYGAYNQNWSLVQHPNTRFMYAANSKGLLEFDGSRWKTYELPRKQVVRSVAVDAQGDVYTGALGEFGYWRPDSRGILTYHSLNALVNASSFRSEEIWHILVTGQGILFQSFAYMYRYRAGRVQRLFPPGNILFIQPVRDRLLLGVLDKGLYELKGDLFTQVRDSEFLGRETVNMILPADSTGMLIGTERAIYRYDGQRFQVFNEQLNTRIQQDRLNRGLLLRTGQYAFGTLRNGVFITRADGRILYHISQKTGLQNSTVLSLCQDTDNNLWLGLDKGIDLIDHSPVRYFTDTEGTLGTVYDMARLGNRLYLGTNQGVYTKQLSVPTESFQLVPGTQGQVWDLAVIDNQLLCGHNRGTFRIEGMQARQIGNITGGWVIRQLRNHPNRLIQGTYTRLCLYRRDNRGQWVFQDTIKGFSGSVRQLEEDETGQIWVNRATNQGIQCLRLSADLTEVVATRTYDDSALHGQATRLYRIQQQLVVLSANRLLVYSPATEHFDDARHRFPWLDKNSRALFRLPDASVLSLYQDGTLHWLRPGHPPVAIPVKTDQWVENYENVVALDTTHLALCRENGFELLPWPSLAHLRSETVPPPLIRQVTSLGPRTYLVNFQGLIQLPALSFTHQQNTIRIDVSTPNYTTPARYSYWLENSMPGWSVFEAFHQKEFTNLPPGHYLFHLKSDQSPAERQLAFDIESPWYWTTWSKLLYVVMLAGLGRLLYQFHLRRVVLRQNQIRGQLEEKLRYQEEHSQREIVTLQKEQLEQGLIQKSEELANSTMLLIRKNELLVQLKAEISRINAQPGGRGAGDGFQRINTLIDTNISTEQDWKLFEGNFNKVHEQFLRHLIDHYPDLSQGDLKLAAYLRMNLSTKEIAQLLNITLRSVELKRYRLRKKLDLDTDINLSEFMIKF